MKKGALILATVATIAATAASAPAEARGLRGHGSLAAAAAVAVAAGVAADAAYGYGPYGYYGPVYYAAPASFPIWSRLLTPTGKSAPKFWAGFAMISSSRACTG